MPDYNYKLIILAADDALKNERLMERAGITKDEAQYIKQRTVSMKGRESSEIYFYGDPDLIAKTYRLLETSTYSQNPDVKVMLNKMLPIAKTSKWAQTHVAGSSGILGDKEAFTDQISKIAPGKMKKVLFLEAGDNLVDKKISVSDGRYVLINVSNGEIKIDVQKMQSGGKYSKASLPFKLPPVFVDGKEVKLSDNIYKGELDPNTGHYIAVVDSKRPITVESRISTGLLAESVEKKRLKDIPMMMKQTRIGEIDSFTANLKVAGLSVLSLVDKIFGLRIRVYEDVPEGGTPSSGVFQPPIIEVSQSLF